MENLFSKKWECLRPTLHFAIISLIPLSCIFPLNAYNALSSDTAPQGELFTSVGKNRKEVEVFIRIRVYTAKIKYTAKKVEKFRTREKEYL